MIAVPVLLSALLIVDALRLRARLEGLPRISPAARSSQRQFHFVSAPGVEVTAEIRRNAAVHAEGHGLSFVDLIPERWSTEEALDWLKLVDPSTLQKGLLSPGWSAGHALAIDEELYLRLAAHRPELLEPKDAAGLHRLTRELRRFAPRGMGAALTPGLTPASLDLAARRQVLQERLGDVALLRFVLQAVVLFSCLLALGVDTFWGVVLLLAFHLQPLIVFSGARLQNKDLWRVVGLRFPVELLSWFRLATTPRWTEAQRVERDAARTWYQAELARGLDRLFDERRSDCPMCGSERLDPILDAEELIQKKPGRFHLDHCLGCGLVFQNPRLNSAGLSFYYRDFYDGLGRAQMEGVFDLQTEQYLNRARTLEGRTLPQRWLDVGCGFGHFSAVAREVWPQTRFEGLDQSENAPIGLARGWLDALHEGSFPDLAPQLAGGFDVVSMHHYLEHTLAPREELKAAWEALAAGGYLLIEVPDPRSRLGRLMGRFWMSWFQPQHLNLLPATLLRTELEAIGFRVEVVHRGEAHQQMDFSLGGQLLGVALRPGVGQPWQRPGGAVERGLELAASLVGLVGLIVGLVLDRSLARVQAREGLSNTYRILARKPAVSQPAETTAS